MTRLLERAREFARDEEGASAAEYVLLASLIAVAIILGAKALGGSVNSKLNTAASNVANP